MKGICPLCGEPIQWATCPTCESKRVPASELKLNTDVIFTIPPRVSTVKVAAILTLICIALIGISGPGERALIWTFHVTRNH